MTPPTGRVDGCTAAAGMDATQKPSTRDARTALAASDDAMPAARTTASTKAMTT
jgi:hypothetical protein